MRIAGARYLATIGTDLLTIQLMGKWGSEIVLGYVFDVPLAALSRRAIDKFNTVVVDSVVQLLEGRVAPVTPTAGACVSTDVRIGDLTSDVNGLFAQIGVTSEAVRLLTEQVDLARRRTDAATRGAKQVFNNSSGVVHASLGRICNPSAWRTRCGWAFGFCNSAVETDVIDHTMKRCAVCWRDLLAGPLPEPEGSEC